MMNLFGRASEMGLRKDQESRTIVSPRRRQPLEEQHKSSRTTQRIGELSAVFSSKDRNPVAKQRRLFGKRSNSTRIPLNPGPTLATFLSGYPSDQTKRRQLFGRLSNSSRSMLRSG